MFADCLKVQNIYRFYNSISSGRLLDENKKSIVANIRKSTHDVKIYEIDDEKSNQKLQIEQ